MTKTNKPTRQRAPKGPAEPQPALSQDLPRLLSIEEVGQVLQLSQHSVRQLIRDGRLQGCRIHAKLLMVDARDVCAFVEACKVSRPVPAPAAAPAEVQG